MVHYSGRVEDIVTMNYLKFMESSKTNGLENSRKAKMADAHNTPGSKLPPAVTRLEQVLQHAVSDNNNAEMKHKANWMME